MGAVATTAAATTTAAGTTVASTTTVAATTIASNETTEAATATVFAGSFRLTMSSAHATEMISAFQTDTSVRTALQSGIATGLSIDSSMVEVTGVSRPAARRLTAGSSVVQVDYTITVPSGSSTTLTASDITGAQTALKEGINDAMTAQSLSYVVTDLSAPEPRRTTVTLTTTTAIAETATSKCPQGFCELRVDHCRAQRRRAPRPLSALPASLREVLSSSAMALRRCELLAQSFFCVWVCS